MEGSAVVQRVKGTSKDKGKDKGASTEVREGKDKQWIKHIRLVRCSKSTSIITLKVCVRAQRTVAER